MPRGFKGEKWDRDLSNADISRLIRGHIKEEKARGNIPRGMKFSVRTSRGNAIDAVLKEIPPDMDLYDKDTCKFVWTRSRENFTCKLNPEITGVFDDLKKFDGQYNYDYSDVQTDYFDVDHYFLTSVDYDLERVEGDRMFDLVGDDAPVGGP